MHIPSNFYANSARAADVKGRHNVAESASVDFWVLHRSMQDDPESRLWAVNTFCNSALDVRFHRFATGLQCARKRYWRSVIHLYASNITAAPLAGSTQYKARDCPGRKRVEINMKQSTVSNIHMGMADAPASGSLRQRPKSKKEKLIILLSKPKDARISSLSKTLNWQNHTVRATTSRLRSRVFAITTAKST